MVSIVANIGMPSLPRKIRLLIHGLGLSSLGSALFLQSTVLMSIIQKGYFRGVEQNPIILSAEFFLTGLAIAYFCYMFIRFILSSK